MIIETMCPKCAKEKKEEALNHFKKWRCECAHCGNVWLEDVPNSSLARAIDLLDLAKYVEELEALVTGQQGIEAEVQAELARAEAKHPDWPKDLFRAALIMVGEHGEMLQALQKYEETGDPKWLAAARVEAVQATTMGVRMLKNWPEVKS